MLPVDIDALCARAEAICRQIAPLDLGDLPLYIVVQSRVPANRGGKSTADGFTAAEPRLAPARHNRDGLARPRAVHGCKRH